MPELLERLVALYNSGVRTRDFSGLLALLADDASLEFEGVPERGAFGGKQAIAAHFADDPPEDAIEIRRWRLEHGQIVAEFRWTDIPEGGGCLIVEPREDRIAAITVALGGPRYVFR